MLHKELGATGVLIPEVGLGTYNYHGGLDPLRRGFEAGALFIDTAESYGTEEMVGSAVRGLRERVFLASKVSPHNFGAAEIRKAAEASLLRLGVDCIDLLQLHYPNPAIPIEETMGAMAQLVDAGKVRFVGVSNFSLEQLQQAQKALGKYPVVSNQVRYNVIDRTIEGGLLQYCQANGITVIAYSPLSKGLHRITDCDPSGVIAELAGVTGKSAAQIALNWCLARDRVVVIPGANSEGHVLENCGASDWRLSAEQLEELNRKLQFRHRSWLDRMLRKHMPRKLQGIAVQVLARLPRGLRRRLT